MQDTRARTSPADEAAYWREAYRDRPYVDPEASFDDYGPAYAYGLDARGRHAERSWDEVETDLSRDWERVKGKSKLGWEHAKAAVKDAWHRLTD